MTIYTTGTVSVTNGSAVVTGSGTAWAVALIAGGIFSSAGVSVPILSVGSDTSLTLAYNWPGTTASGAVYAIARENSEAADIVDLNDKLSRVLVTLSLVGITPDASGTIAERDALTLAVGDKGFLFLHAELGYDFEFYRWSGSAWVGPFATRGIQGASGLIGVWRGPWLTATSYFVNDAVSQSGNSYICVTAHTSGTFSTDLAAGKWQLVAQKGDTGAAGVVQSIVAGSNVTVDNTDPAHPVVSAGSGINSILTTRGDIVYRNATTAARLAASTAGYLLQTNGAGADPAWVGFLQAGTSATTRTWQDKVRERISVKDFGAVGDGATNDTSAIQAAETYRASVAGELVFPQGVYLTDGTVINRANGGGWRGVGNARLIASANNKILIDVSGAVVSSTATRPFYVVGLELHNNGMTGCTGYREAAPYYTRISGCKFNSLQYSAIFTSPNGSTQTGWITISDIFQVGEGSWLFRGFDNTRYIFNINIVNFNQQGTGASTWSGVSALFHFQRAVSVYLTNINAASLDGATKGVYMQGDCQGIFLSNVIIGWPTYGIQAVQWTDTLIPAYVYIANCGMDQPSVAGYDIAGRTWLLSNINATNGRDRSSTGPGIHIEALATDIAINGALVAYMNNDGLAVETGAAKVRIAGLCSENNNQIAGSYYDVNLNACSFNDVVLYGRNIIGSAGVSATGQRIVNGVTSKTVSKANGASSTTAVTTQEDLKTYTIPANTLKPGQRLRLRAFGTTAANANSKTIRLWFGGNSIVDHNGTWNALPWVMEAVIDVKASNSQDYNGNAFVSATALTTRQGSLTVTDTSTIIVKCTGQNGTASAGDITCNGFSVELID